MLKSGKDPIFEQFTTFRQDYIENLNKKASEEQYKPLNNSFVTEIERMERALDFEKSMKQKISQLQSTYREPSFAEIVFQELQSMANLLISGYLKQEQDTTKPKIPEKLNQDEFEGAIESNTSIPPIWTDKDYSYPYSKQIRGLITNKGLKLYGLIKKYENTINDLKNHYERVEAVEDFNGFIDESRQGLFTYFAQLLELKHIDFSDLSFAPSDFTKDGMRAAALDYHLTELCIKAFNIDSKKANAFKADLKKTNLEKLAATLSESTSPTSLESAEDRQAISEETSAPAPKKKSKSKKKKKKKKTAPNEPPSNSSITSKNIPSESSAQKVDAEKAQEKPTLVDEGLAQIPEQPMPMPSEIKDNESTTLKSPKATMPDAKKTFVKNTKAHAVDANKNKNKNKKASLPSKPKLTHTPPKTSYVDPITTQDLDILSDIRKEIEESTGKLRWEDLESALAKYPQQFAKPNKTGSHYTYQYNGKFPVTFVRPHRGTSDQCFKRNIVQRLKKFPDDIRRFISTVAE